MSGQKSVIAEQTRNSTLLQSRINKHMWCIAWHNVVCKLDNLEYNYSFITNLAETWQISRQLQ